MKENKGITLVALVITIIILIILAGITISMVLGEDGLIGKAKKGAEEYKNAAADEQTMLGKINDFLDGNVDEPEVTVTKYTITYDANDGDSVPEPQSVEIGEDLTLTEERAEKFGYIFEGWSTNQAATEATYFPGQTYTFNENTTLYAVWTLRLCLYNRGDECTSITGGWTYEQIQENGDGSKQSDSLYLGWKNEGANTDSYFKTNNNMPEGEYKVEITYKKTGVENSGQSGKWATIYVYDSENRLTYRGTGTYTETISVEFNGSSPLIIGNWSSYDYIYEVYLVQDDTYKETINITYNANGGTGGPVEGKQYKTEKNNTKITTLQPSKEGYLFSGWSTNPNATEPMYYSGKKYTISSDVTLYAVWSKKIYVYNRGNEYTERTDGIIDASSTGFSKYSNYIYISTLNYITTNYKKALPKKPYKICVVCDNPQNVSGSTGMYSDVYTSGNTRVLVFNLNNSWWAISASSSVSIYEIYLIPMEDEP